MAPAPIMLVAAARRSAVISRCAPAAPRLAFARAVCVCERRAASGVAGSKAEEVTELTTKPSAETAAAKKAIEPMDPAEFRRQQEAAGYVMGRKNRLRAPLSDYAPPGSSHALAFQDGFRDDIIKPGRNASEKESDETHQRFESVLATFACITFAIWVLVSFNDMKSAVTGEYEPEIQTQIAVRTARSLVTPFVASNELPSH